MIYRFDSLGSTNDEAQSPKYQHGDIVIAERQTNGRGQRGNKWISGQGLNLTLSAVVCLPQFEARRQFLVSQCVALAVCDVLRHFGLEPRIKWTNDIYIGEHKIVGILIENRLSGSYLQRSVVGIGLNVNQEEFDPLLPNPTSMALALGRSLDRSEVLQQLSSSLFCRFEELKGGQVETLTEQYHKAMYRRGEEHPFRLPSGQEQLGTIVGVEPSGELVIEWQSAERGAYRFGEVEFVIETRKR